MISAMTEPDDSVDIARMHAGLLKATADHIEAIANEPDTGTAEWVVRLGSSVGNAQTSLSQLKRDLRRLARPHV